MRRAIVRIGCGIAFALVAAVPAAAGDDVPARYGTSYTAEELAAIDRSLHAGNMTREDLAFRKDNAKGIGCFPIVREMLRDPLLIAPTMDAIAAATDRGITETLAEALAIGSVDAGDLVDVSRSRQARTLSLLEAAFAAEFDRSKSDPKTPREVLAALLPIPALTDPLKSATGGNDAERAIAEHALRSHLPQEMAMHPIAGTALREDSASVDDVLKRMPASFLRDAAAKIDIDALARSWAAMALSATKGGPATWPKDVFPTERPIVEDSPIGRVALGTRGDDVYVGDYAVIVDPGGNDRYERGHFAAAYDAEHAVGLLIDLGGNDIYDCRDIDVTLGAATFGIAALVDLGAGNDRYSGGHVSLGAAIGGVAVLYDDGGSDVYEGKAFTQGAAAYGIGILLDDSVQPAPVVRTDDETPDPIAISTFDNDRLHAWANAQGFSRCKGVAFCINKRGNDTYEAGGVYLDAPLFTDRYVSFSQGFSIGERNVDHAGGIAMLIDREGNDRYLGDIYNQGVGYWYAAGFLWDGGGNDLYEMTQYGQGSGIHLAIGGLVDVAGNDAYVMHSGLGQGGSHDYAASILHDRAGNDRYLGMTSCNGCGLTNSVGIHLDRAGNDTYAGRRESLNVGRPARGAGSIGVLVDLEGTDDYLGIMSDGVAWKHSDVGVGIDVTVPDAAGKAATLAGPSAPSSKVDIPPILRSADPLDAKTFEAVWEIAVRWEVGDNQVIVPLARKKLVAWGKDVLPMLDASIDAEHHGLEIRAYVDVFKGLAEGGSRDGVLDLLARNLASPSERRRRVALQLVGELAVTDLEADVVRLLASEDDLEARRAAGVLEKLKSHAGDARLKAWLEKDGDERRILVALGTLMGLDGDVWTDVRDLLDHPLVSVRSRLATLAAEHQKTYGAALRSELTAKISNRGRRTVLDALTRGPVAPDPASAAAAERLVDHDDWGTRGDTARWIRSWAKEQVVQFPSAVAALERRLATETDPFVKFAGRPKAP